MRRKWRRIMQGKLLGRLVVPVADPIEWATWYETWDEAEQGHREACAWARAHLAELDAKLTVTHE